jgi:hypothetical protein
VTAIDVYDQSLAKASFSYEASVKAAELAKGSAIWQARLARELAVAGAKNAREETATAAGAAYADAASAAEAACSQAILAAGAARLSAVSAAGTALAADRAAADRAHEIALAAADKALAKERIDNLHAHYLLFYPQLLVSPTARTKAEDILKEHFELLNILLKISFNEAIQRDIVAQGELLSTKLFHILLEEQSIPAVLLPALDFMSIDENSEPELGKISEQLTALLDQYPEQRLFITQGYICKNHRNEIDNLKRGGSDYTASLVAAALQASVAASTSPFTAASIAVIASWPTPNCASRSR